MGPFYLRDLNSVLSDCWNYTWCYIWWANAFCLFSQRLVNLCETYYLPYASGKIYWRTLSSFFNALFSPLGLLFLGSLPPLKTQTPVFSSQVQWKCRKYYAGFFFFFLLDFFALRCESANTLRTKRCREVWLRWMYYSYCQDPCPLSPDCLWSVFEVFKHLFYVFFPKFIGVLCGEINLKPAIEFCIQAAIYGVLATGEQTLNTFLNIE